MKASILALLVFVTGVFAQVPTNAVKISALPSATLATNDWFAVIHWTGSNYQTSKLPWSELAAQVTSAIAPLATTNAVASAVAPLASTNALASAAASLASSNALAVAAASLAASNALASAVSHLVSTDALASATASMVTTDAMSAAVDGLITSSALTNGQGHFSGLYTLYAPQPSSHYPAIRGHISLLGDLTDPNSVRLTPVAGSTNDGTWSYFIPIGMPQSRNLFLTWTNYSTNATFIQWRLDFYPRQSFSDTFVTTNSFTE